MNKGNRNQKISENNTDTKNESPSIEIFNRQYLDKKRWSFKQISKLKQQNGSYNLSRIKWKKCILVSWRRINKRSKDNASENGVNRKNE